MHIAFNTVSLIMNGAVSHCVQRKTKKNINEATHCYNYNFTNNVILAFNTRLFCGLYKAFIQAIYACTSH